LILSRYLFKEIWQSFLAISLLLLLMVISGRLVNYLADATSGEIPTQALMTLIAIKIPRYLGEMLPLSLFLAVLFALGRFYRDSEMTALQAAGVSYLQLGRQVLAAVTPVVLLVLAITAYVSPWSAHTEAALIAKIQEQSQLDTLAPGRFQVSADGNRLLFVENLSRDRSELEHVFVAQGINGVDGPNQIEVWAAQRGIQRVDEQSGYQYLVLQEGNLYQGVPGQADYRVMAFEEYGFELRPKSNAKARIRSDALSTRQLWEDPHPYMQSELQWRLSLPIAIWLLALLAVPLSRTAPRSGRFSRIVPGVLVYVLYMNSLNIARSWVEHGDLPVHAGLWVVHVALAIIISVYWLYFTGVLRRVWMRVAY
jgi:lipopolysaccharide export system permease protein